MKAGKVDRAHEEIFRVRILKIKLRMFGKARPKGRSF